MYLQVDEDKFPSLPGGPSPAPPPPPSAAPPGPQPDPIQASSSHPSFANPKQPSNFALWGQPNQDQARNPNQNQSAWDENGLDQNGWGAPVHEQHGWEPNPTGTQANWQSPEPNGQHKPRQDQHQSWAQPEKPHQGIWKEPQQQGTWEQLMQQGRWEQDQGHWGNPSQNPHQHHHQVLDQGGWDLPKQDSWAGPAQGIWEPQADHRADSNRWTTFICCLTLMATLECETVLLCCACAVLCCHGKFEICAALCCAVLSWQP